MSTPSLTYHNPFSFSPRRVEFDLDAIEDEDSPFPEVRASTVVPLALFLVSNPMGKFLAFSLPIASYHLPLLHAGIDNLMYRRFDAWRHSYECGAFSPVFEEGSPGF